MDMGFQNRNARFLFLLTFVFPFFAIKAYGLPPVEQDILLRITQAWTIPNTASGFLSSWVKGNDCSAWKGVKCDKTGKVTELSLSGNNIKGKLSNSIICGLSNLINLDLGSNQFSGSIPSCIQNLKFLQGLSLNANGLDGKLPESICSLKMMGWLDLSENKLTGGIPVCINNINNLYHLDLRGNRLSGSIPDSICKLVNLYHLDFYDNKLTGSIPTCIQNLKNIKSLFKLSKNQLSGNIPEAICKLEMLENFDVALNELTGPIPSCIQNLKNLLVLDVGDNKLSGEITNVASICTLQKLTYLDLGPNQFSGFIPLCITKLKNLSHLSLNGNKLVGKFPASICALEKIEWLDLSQNQLSGPIPACIKNLKKLNYFYLNDNYLNGNPVVKCDKFLSCNFNGDCFSGVSNQRVSSECSSFCGANSGDGACSGYGTCILDSNKKATCVCDPGRLPPDCKLQEKPPLPPSSNDFRNTWLNPEPVAMVHRNPYFRFASFQFTGTEDAPNWNLAATVDWRSYDIAPVEDQQDCNACWAIAPATAVECLLSVSNRGLKVVSKQQILDCGGRNQSCGGGWPTDAFEYLSTNGVARAVDYPWAKRNKRCSATSNPKFQNVKISMYEEVDFYGSFGLILAVQNQPVVVNVQSSEPVFQNYNSKSGIMDRGDCFTSIVDHTVVVVGYNLFKGEKPYWILRNSWGTGWGEQGYMRLAYTGGLGICGIHSTPAFYPVLASDGNPCVTPNSCGSGQCSVDSKTGLNKCSQCPPSFITVKNLDGSETCAPLNICIQKSSNPCGVGACVDDMKGSYTCICPIGYVQTQYSDNNQYTCVEASRIQKELFYTVQSQDTCSLISLSFGLSLQEFKKKNSKVDCNNLVPGLTKVNVTQDSKWAGCAVKYSWNNGDTCYDVAFKLKISSKEIISLNPDLNCNDIVLGSQVCVKKGNPPLRTPPCGVYHDVSSTDTCQSIVAKYKLDFFSFLLYNPGINCASLVPRASNPILGQMVCVDFAEPYGRSRAKCPGRTYQVRKFDTCTFLIVKYFARSIQLFKKRNFGSPCTSKLKVGETICL